MNWRRPHRLRLMAICLAGLGALAAPELAPHDYSRQFDPAAGRHLPPGSRRYVVELSDTRELLAERVVWTERTVALHRLGGWRYIPRALVESTPASIRRQTFLLGTDRLGRDCLSRLLFASRISLFIALLATATAGLVGISVGAIAGFSGGILDALLMRTVDFLLSFPQLFVLLLSVSLFDAGPATLIIILGASTWMPLARIMRAEIHARRREGFVLAAIAVGCRPAVILCRHLIPSALGPTRVALTLGIGDVVLLESALSFLGFGISPPMPTWGRMIADGAPDIGSAWWVVTFPGLALVATVLIVNLVGDTPAGVTSPRLFGAGDQPF